MANFVFERIKAEVIEKKHYSVIIDETSDISQIEQVSICPAYDMFSKAMQREFYFLLQYSVKF